MTTVSVDKLRAHYVCVDQLALFRATFGDEATVTEPNMRHAVDVGRRHVGRVVYTLAALGIWRWGIGTLAEYAALVRVWGVGRGF
jgi:hypothetical protein